MATTASAHKAKFQSLRVLLSSTAYRKWNFRVAGGHMVFIKSKTLERRIYSAPPLVAEVGSGNIRKLIKPLYGPSTSR